MKQRNGFVSNSSSSSFLVALDSDKRIETLEDVKKHIDWTGFYTHIVFAIKNDELGIMTPEDWSQMNGDRLAQIMFKFIQITNSYLKDKTFDEAMQFIFEDDIIKKPIIPRFEEYRTRKHTHEDADGTKHKTTYMSDPYEYTFEEEDAFDDFEFHYRQYINYLKIHSLYLAVKEEEDPFAGVLLLSLGNDSDIMYEARKKGLITDYEYKFAQDIRYMNLMKVIFPEGDIEYYDYS